MRHSLLNSMAARSRFAVILFELALKSSQQGESIGGGSGKAGKYSIVVEPANLSGASLHDSFAQCNLAVSSERNVVFFADKQHGSAANDWCFFRHFR